MDYGEINKYLKRSIDEKIRQSTSPDKEFFKYFKNKIENHTTNEYKFLHYLDNIPIDEDICDMEDNFLISCYNEYMYQYRNNMLKPSGSIIKETIIKETINKILQKQFLPIRPVSVAAFGKKS
tara:strand:+ start:3760 stop:4128 length:369 start_codon:yes stop_codon:yes gene_type:complete